MRYKIFLILVLLLFIGGNLDVYSQETSTEDQRIAEADRNFKDENYQPALELYSRLLSIHPHDVTYTYRLGVCMVVLNQDLPKAIDYLKEILPKSEEMPLAYYYLGVACQYTYQFDDAISNFNVFKQKASSSLIKKLDVDRKIIYCENAKSVFNEVNDLYVYQKKEISFDGFFRAYSEMEGIPGSMITIGSDFESAIDRKSENPNAIMYIMPKRDRIIFSSYGPTGNNGKDIYQVRKMSDGSWSQPQSISDVINSPYDEDFPYITPDGLTLYFCSNGHNSMGGYDIFKSTYDQGTKNWSVPENLNFSINTPYDEYLYVPDSTNKFVVFASNRSTVSGQVSLYKVRVDKHKKVETPVSIANIQEIKEENPDEYKKTISEISKKADLNVNVSKETAEELDGSESETNIGLINLATVESAQSRSGKKKKSYQQRNDGLEINEKSTNEDIIRVSKAEALNLQEEVDDLIFKAGAAKEVAEDKNKEAELKLKEAGALDRESESTTDDGQKGELKTKAQRTRNEGEALKNEAAIAYNMAIELEKSVVLKKKEAKDAFAFANELEVAIKSGSPENAIAMLDEFSKKLESSYVDYDDKVINAQTPNQQDYDDKMFEVETFKKEYTTLKDEIQTLRDDAGRIRNDADNSKKKAVKEQLIQQAEGIEQEANEKESKANEVNSKLQLAQSQADSIYYKLTVINQLFAEISTSADSSQEVNKGDANLSIDQKFSKSSYNEGAPLVASAAKKEQPKKPVETKKETTVDTDAQREKIHTSIKQDAQNVVRQVEGLLKDAKSLSDAALVISNNKSKQAADLLSKAEGASPNEAAVMRYQSNKLNEEADLSLGVYNVVLETINKLKLLQEEANDSYVNVEKELAVNNVDAAREIVNSQRNRISESDATKPLKSEDLFNNLSSVFFDQSNAKYEEAMSIESEVNALKIESDSLGTEKEDKKTSKKRKEEIDIRVTEIDGVINRKNEQINTLKTEADILAKKSEKAKAPNQISADITSKYGKVNANEVAFIDKTTLQDNIGRVDNYFVEHPEYIAKPQVESEQPVAETPVVAQNTETPEESNVKDEVVVTEEEPAPKVEEKKEIVVKEPEKVPVEESKVEQPVVVSQPEKSEVVKTESVVKPKEQEVVQKAVAQAAEPAKPVTSKVETTKEKQTEKVEPKPAPVSKNNLAENKVEPKQSPTEKKSSQNVSSEEIGELESMNNQLFAQYQSGLNNLQTIRIEIDPNIGDKYSDVESVYTAAQLEKEAENLSSKASSNVSRIQMSGDNVEKKSLLLQSIEWRNLSLENQKRAMDLYSQAKSTAIVASKEPVSTPIETPASPVQEDAYSAEKRKLESMDTTQISPEVMVLANEMTSEAESYYQSAKKKREEALAEQNIERKTLLNNTASTEEKIASEKLEKAKKMLKLESNVAEAVAESVDEDEKETDKVLTPQESELVADSPYSEVVTVNSKDLNKPVEKAISTEKPVIKEAAPETVSKHIASNAKETVQSNINTTESSKPEVSSPRLIPELDALFDKKTYEGIVFKVQLVAYKGTPNYSLFNNIDPMSYEETGTGFTRYMAGLFTDFASAETAQQELKGKGFSSAYVVAYRDGKRINVNEARSSMANGEKVSTNVVASYSKSSAKKYDVAGVASVGVVSAESTGVNVAGQTGLMYSVQLAVYAKPNAIGSRFGLTDIYYDQMPDGRFRYLNGAFKTRAEASVNKQKVNALGLKDAYVVVYYNGKKITLNEAAQLEK